jgi:hypothetical protein
MGYRSDRRFENLIHPTAIISRQADEDGARGLPCWLDDLHQSSLRSRIYERSLRPCEMPRKFSCKRAEGHIRMYVRI